MKNGSVPNEAVLSLSNIRQTLSLSRNDFTYTCKIHRFVIRHVPRRLLIGLQIELRGIEIVFGLKEVQTTIPRSPSPIRIFAGLWLPSDQKFCRN